MCFSNGKYAEEWLVQRLGHVSGHNASTPEFKLMSLGAIFPVDIRFAPESISVPPPLSGSMVEDRNALPLN